MNALRIRSIRPEFWASEDIGRLDIADRLLFVGLWSYVDDNGVGRDVDALIASSLFPFDLSRHSRDTLARVSRGLATLSDGGQITRYTVDGSPYLYVDAWNAHQRIDKPGRSRYPLPTCGNAVIRESVARASRECRDISPIGEGEKGRRGEGEKGQGRSLRSLDRSPASDEVLDAEIIDEAADEIAAAFMAFWDGCPRKVGKAKARDAFERAVWRAGSPRPILDGLERHGPAWAAKIDAGEKSFIPHPTTWLNRDGWEDEPPPPPRSSQDGASRAQTSRGRDRAALFASWAQNVAEDVEK